MVGFQLLQDLMAKKRESVLKDIDKVRVLSRFIRWKKFTAYHRLLDMHKKSVEPPSIDNQSTISEEEDDLDIEKYRKQNEINKMILKNQIQIGLSLQNEIRKKQEIIDGMSVIT